MSIFAQGAFQQNANATPDQIKRKRAMIQAMMPQGQTRYIGEGLGNLASGIMGGIQNRKLDKAEGAGIQGAGDIFARAVEAMRNGGGGTGGSSSFGGGSPGGTWTPGAPAPKATDLPPGMGGEALSFGGPSMPQDGSGGLSFGSVGMSPQEMLIAGAEARGWNPLDVATAISYETGGTFDPLKRGPTTQWGTHDGLIQFGDPQGNQHGAVFDQGSETAMTSQLDPKNGAVWNYLESVGVKPGMGLDNIYSAINAGAPGRFNASDANNGGAPGTVADKVAGMGDHRAKAAQFLGGTWTPSEGGGGNITMSAQNEPQQDLGALYQAMANPFMSQEQRAVLTQMIQQGEQQADPSYQMGLEKQRMELDQMRNPQADPMDAVTLAQAQLNLEQDRAGGGAADLPTDIQSLQYRADAAGLVRGTPEYQSFMLNGGGDPATYRALEMQAIQSGLVKGTPEFQNFMATRGAGVAEYAKTEQGNLADTATGGAAAAAIEQGKIEGQATGAAITGLSAAESKASQGIALIDSIVADPALAQVTGMFQGRMPAYTQAGTDLNVKIKQAKGKAFIEAFESLKGGGAISEREGEAATAAIARLEQAQSTEAYVDALTELKGMMQTGLDRARTKAAPALGATGAQSYDFSTMEATDLLKQDVTQMTIEDLKAFNARMDEVGL